MTALVKRRGGDRGSAGGIGRGKRGGGLEGGGGGGPTCTYNGNKVILNYP